MSEALSGATDRAKRGRLVIETAAPGEAGMMSKEGRF
jgi:hypothetical protein